MITRVSPSSSVPIPCIALCAISAKYSAGSMATRAENEQQHTTKRVKIRYEKIKKTAVNMQSLDMCCYR